MPHRIAIFVSGTGSNARRMIEHFATHKEIEVALVLSNKASAKALNMAAEHGVPTHVTSRSELYTDAGILPILDRHGITFIVLAGFLWLIPEYLVSAYAGRIVNIHPALLPKYGGKGMYGMHVHRAVAAAGESESGISIHYVNAEYDEGALIYQATCPVQASDMPEDIAARVLRLEHEHYPRVVERLLSGDTHTLH